MTVNLPGKLGKDTVGQKGNMQSNMAEYLPGSSLVVDSVCKAWFYLFL